jgi:hypothetical protein
MIITNGQNVSLALIKEPESVLYRHLGEQPAASVFSTITLLRHDKNPNISQQASALWKQIVSKPAKVLSDVIDTLVTKMLSLLCKGDANLTELVDKALDSNFSRFQTKAVAPYIPALRNLMASPRVADRVAAMHSLVPVITAAGRNRFTAFNIREFGPAATIVTLIVPTLMKGLCDPDEAVRREAGSAFGDLYRVAGNKAMAEIINPLIDGLKSSSGADAQDSLSALCQIVRVRGTVVLPVLMPILFQTPISTVNLDAIDQISQYTTETIKDFIGNIIEENIIPCMLSVMDDTEAKGKLQKASFSLCVSAGKDGADTILNTLNLFLKPGQHDQNTPALTLLLDYLKDSRSRMWIESAFPVKILATRILDFFVSPVVELQSLAWHCLAALLQAIDKAQSPQYIEVIQNHIEGLPDRLRQENGASPVVPAFGLPKGIAPVLGLYTNAILLASPEVREIAANGIRD